jgi:beta-glucosidase
VTFPKSAADLPTAGSARRWPGELGQIDYGEGVLMGYRWYDAKRIQPLFPFGFGLSYTRFAYSDLRVGPTGASATVTNVGKRAGAEVAQLYLGLPSPSPDLVQPPSSLKGFDRVSLAPGQSARVSFPLGPRSFAYWDTASDGWRVAPGCYVVKVGRSSRDLPLRARVPLRGGSCPAS